MSRSSVIRHFSTSCSKGTFRDRFIGGKRGKGKGKGLRDPLVILLSALFSAVHAQDHALCCTLGEGA